MQFFRTRSLCFVELVLNDVGSFAATEVLLCINCEK